MYNKSKKRNYHPGEGMMAARRFVLCFSVFILLIMVMATQSLFAQDNYMRVLEWRFVFDDRCTGTEIEDLPAMTKLWWQEIETETPGWHKSELMNIAKKRWLADYDTVNWGQDEYILEKYDIVLLGGLGNYESNPLHFRLYMNDYYGTDCYLDPNEAMHLGDGLWTDDIEILYVVASFSMSQDSNMFKNTWRPVFGGIHQVLGFHGLTYFDANLQDEYEAVAHDSFYNSLALEWKDNLYIHDYAGWGYDNCPVAYTGRASLADADNILDYEQYDNTGTWSDVESPSYWRRRFVDNCKPLGGEPM